VHLVGCHYKNRLIMLLLGILCIVCRIYAIYLWIRDNICVKVAQLLLGRHRKHGSITDKFFSFPEPM